MDHSQLRMHPIQAVDEPVATSHLYFRQSHGQSQDDSEQNCCFHPILASRPYESDQRKKATILATVT
jgi:hypothetical protein